MAELMHMYLNSAVLIRSNNYCT